MAAGKGKPYAAQVGRPGRGGRKKSWRGLSMLVVSVLAGTVIPFLVTSSSGATARHAASWSQRRVLRPGEVSLLGAPSVFDGAMPVTSMPLSNLVAVPSVVDAPRGRTGGATARVSVNSQESAANADTF